MPKAISQYVLKVYGRCDLACDYCYVYEHADQSWRIKPRAVSQATVERAAERIAEHAAVHQLGVAHVILHGGEPLLLGLPRLRSVLDVLRSRITPVTRLDLHIQTNGVRLDEQFCELLAKYDVKVGVSLDGDRVAQDLHRRFPNGRSSHSQVRRALALLRHAAYKHLYSGILCTVDLANDPIAVYEALLAEAPPHVDLLLPHATWDDPPVRPGGVPAPYAAWLGQIYARWTADGRPMPIRLFDSVLSMARGGPSWSEAIGLDPVDLLVIETDGGWEQVDSLKTAFDGAPATGMDVFTHTVDEAAAHPGITGRRTGLAALCPTCRSCPVVRICGGGLYAHRYRTGNGFDNPSAYCTDLKALITEMTERSPIPPTQAVKHRLPADAFDSLSAGPGDRGVVASLAQTSLSLTRALVAAVASAQGGKGTELARVTAAGWDLLTWLDHEEPEAVREVLLHPYTQAWAVRCLHPPAGADPEMDRAHLAGLAAAAALSAGVTAEMALPVRDGALYLPTFGALRVGSGAGSSVVVSLSSGRVDVGRGREWQLLRRTVAGGMSLAVDDIDPFRDCQVWPATGRLSDQLWRSWQRALSAAGGYLELELPSYARAIGAGLRTVVPLCADVTGRSRSGTSRHAFGAVAVALPEDIGTLAMLLVHEFQHVKLNALLDLYDLFDVADERLLQVPWRPDPRPVEGVLHGAYAHLAVADLWRSKAQEGADDRDRLRFDQYRSWVREALDALSETGALTGYGERFVDGMRATIETWIDDY